jgi:hypothetical protein
MEVSSQDPVNLAYFYPHSTSCPQRQSRASQHGVELKTYRDLYLEKEAVFDGHTHQEFVLPNGQKDWDDADVEVMSQHLELASKFGTGLFWDLFVGCANGKKIVELKKPYEVMLRLNRNVPFSVMFSYNRARVVTPVPEGFKEHDRCFDLTKDTARWMVDYLSMGTINHPNFVHINGRPVVAFGAFSLSFDNCDDKITQVVSEFKEYATSKWGKVPYIVAVICDHKGAKNASQSNLFDATTGYCYLPSFDPQASPIQNYTDRVNQSLSEWHNIANESLPFFAPFSLGWDSSLRAQYSSSIFDLSGQYPHAPIVVDSTPSQIQQAAKLVQEFNNSNNSPIRPIFSFNEVEEGAALLPVLNNSNQIDYQHTQAALAGLTF